MWQRLLDDYFGAACGNCARPIGHRDQPLVLESCNRDQDEDVGRELEVEMEIRTRLQVRDVIGLARKPKIELVAFVLQEASPSNRYRPR